MPTSTRYRYLVVQFLVWCGIVLAQNNTNPCFDADFTSFNASAAVSIPALSPGGLSLAGNLTVSTAVTQVLDWSKNTSIIRQNYWLSTDPLITTPAQDLPFGGCIFMLFQAGDFSTWKLNNQVKSGKGETNSTKILPKGCNDAYIQQLVESVLFNTNDGNRNNTLDVCQALNTTVPKECLKVWEPVMGGPYGPFGLTNWSAPWNDAQEGSCPSGDSSRVFNGSATENGFYTDSYSRFPSGELKTPIGNNSVYDYYVQRTTTLLFVTWPREGRNTEPDVRSVCLTPQQKVEAGSRNPQGNAASNILPTRALLWMVAILALMLST